jgi:hypothetical protein
MEEVKLILFINQMKHQAQREKGRIITLIGNHDTLNFLNSPSIQLFVTKYAYSTDIKINNKIYSRREFFNTEHYGASLFAYDGTGILVKINDFVFTHACLLRDKNFTFEKIKEMNNKINEYFYHKKFKDLNFIFIYLHNFLNGRFQSNWDEVSRIKLDDTSYCNGLISTLNLVFPSVEPPPILVVGHEVQSSSFKPLQPEESVYSFSNIIAKGHHTNSTVTIPINIQPKDPEHYESTYTMNCTTSRRGYPLVIRIDVAMSTMFDMPYYEKYTKTPHDREEATKIFREKLLRIKSRCPHVLHIEYRDGNIRTIESIRSSTYNTLLHQRRIRQADYPKEIYELIGVPYRL